MTRWHAVNSRADILSVLAGVVMLALLAVAGVWGLHLRDVAWTQTQPVRFHGDIVNGLNQGRQILRDAGYRPHRVRDDQTPPTWGQWFAAYLGRYDRVLAETGDRPSLDYSPLRLLVMGGWVKLCVDRGDLVNRYNDDLVQPLLTFNLAMELAAVALMAALVMTVLRRAGKTWVHAGAAGAGAAILLWLNPAVILNAHTWPQWDVWVLPFFLAACLLCVLGRFGPAGFAVGIGAMFKGQILMVAPLLMLGWAIFAFQPVQALRWIVGFVLAFAVVGSVWLIQNWAAIGYVLSGVGVAATLAWWPREHRYALGWWLTIAGGLFLLAWPIVLTGTDAALWAAIGLLSIVGLCSLVRTTAGQLTACAAALACSIVAAGVIFGGSFAWLVIGFPTDRYRELSMGPTMNLPAILQYVYHWGLTDPVLTESIEGGIPIRNLLAGIFAVLTLILSAAAAWHWRRRDPSLLLAMITPWALMFAVMPQMHERYLIWGAALSAAWVGVSLGATLLHVLLTLFATGLIWIQLIFANGDGGKAFSPELTRVLAPMLPHMGWAVTLAALVALYLSLWPRDSRKSASLRVRQQEKPGFEVVQKNSEVSPVTIRA